MITMIVVIIALFILAASGFRIGCFYLLGIKKNIVSILVMIFNIFVMSWIVLNHISLQSHFVEFNKVPVNTQVLIYDNNEWEIIEKSVDFKGLNKDNRVLLLPKDGEIK